jgi:hypothetical protein
VPGWGPPCWPAGSVPSGVALRGGGGAGGRRCGGRRRGWPGAPALAAVCGPAGLARGAATPHLRPQRLRPLTLPSTLPARAAHPRSYKAAVAKSKKGRLVRAAFNKAKKAAK